MANTVQAADIVELTMMGKFEGNDVMNKFHYACISVSGAPQGSQAVFAALDTNLSGVAGLVNLVRLLAPSNYTLRFNRYQVIAPVRQVAYPIAKDVGGLNTFTTLTGNIAVALTKRGDLAGRKNISTTHVIGTTAEDLIEAGKLTATAKTLAENIAAFMDNQVSITVGGVDYEFGPVIFHKNEPANPTPITSVIVQDTVRVMRRRTLNVGS